MLLTQDDGVKSFIANLTSQLSGTFPFAALPMLWFLHRHFQTFLFQLALTTFLFQLAPFLMKNGWRPGSYKGWFLWSWVRLLPKYSRDGISVSKPISRSSKRGIFHQKILFGFFFFYLPNAILQYNAHFPQLIVFLGFESQGFQGKEWQRNHERDSSYHATNCILHHLLAMPGWTLLVILSHCISL